MSFSICLSGMATYMSCCVVITVCNWCLLLLFYTTHHINTYVYCVLRCHPLDKAGGSCVLLLVCLALYAHERTCNIGSHL